MPWGNDGGGRGDRWSSGGGRFDDRRRERERDLASTQRHNSNLASGLSGKVDEPLRRVQVDALVVLQIMKHCKQNAPHPVTGVLLGLDVGDTMQVTHSFEKAREDDRERDGAAHGTDSEEHQVEMMRKLRDVNVDTNTVGWYQTTHLGQFFSTTAIDTQYHWQTENHRSVFLVYDSLQSAVGKPSFQAMQLSPTFMKKYAESTEYNRAAMAEFASHDMFREVPIVINSSAIVEAFLIDWAITDPMFSSSNVPVLDLENQVFLEKNVQLLMSSLTDLAEEQTKLVQYERQAARKGDAPTKGRDRFRQQQPRQLDTMILSQQIKNYCKAIDGFAADTFGKLFLVSNKPGSSAEAEERRA